MRFLEIVSETKLNGITIIPLDQFVEKGYPTEEDEDLEEDEIIDEAEFGLVMAGKLPT